MKKWRPKGRRSCPTSTYTSKDLQRSDPGGCPFCKDHTPLSVKWSFSHSCPQRPLPAWETPSSTVVLLTQGFGWMLYLQDPQGLNFSVREVEVWGMVPHLPKADILLLFPICNQLLHADHPLPHLHVPKLMSLLQHLVSLSCQVIYLLRSTWNMDFVSPLHAHVLTP